MDYQRYPFFYETYPLLNIHHNNYENEFLKSIYSKDLQELKQIVEQECDKLDFRGSMIYDEFPDRVMFNKKCKEISAYSILNSSYGRKCSNISQLNDIICVLFSSEIQKRRADRKNFLIY